jgi:cytochrome oxidase Cu insertion factor (SCO1/SenC/PrrC family)
MNISPRGKGIFIFIMLCVIFILPIILAGLYFKEIGKFHEKTINYGELIQPPRQLEKLALNDANNKPIPSQTFHGKWLFLYVNPGVCKEDCQKELYNIRQVRFATGKNMDRIQRAIITFTKPKADPELQQLLQGEYSGTIFALAQPKQFENVMDGLDTTKLAMTQGYLYLVDPLGNIMMEYPLNANPSLILQDLQKLLKVSQIG